MKVGFGDRIKNALSLGVKKGWKNALIMGAVGVSVVGAVLGWQAIAAAAVGGTLLGSTALASGVNGVAGFFAASLPTSVPIIGGASINGAFAGLAKLLHIPLSASAGWLGAGTAMVVGGAEAAAAGAAHGVVRYGITGYREAGQGGHGSEAGPVQPVNLQTHNLAPQPTLAQAQSANIMRESVPITPELAASMVQPQPAQTVQDSLRPMQEARTASACDQAALIGASR